LRFAKAAAMIRGVKTAVPGAEGCSAAPAGP
jgi:hypothetical protein